MTCIVAVKDLDSGEVWMGGDSAGVEGLHIAVRKDPKVFINGEFLMGYTTSFRMGQILRYMKLPARLPPMADDYEYMVTCVIPEIRTSLKEGGYTQIKDNREEGGCFLIGYRSHIYEIESDFQVGERIEEYESVGCGRPYALGSLRMTTDKFPKERIKAALETAQHFNGGVRAPFNILKI